LAAGTCSIERLGLGGDGRGLGFAELEGAGAFPAAASVIKMLATRAPWRSADRRHARRRGRASSGLLHHPGIVARRRYLESETEGQIFVLEFVDGMLAAKARSRWPRKARRDAARGGSRPMSGQPLLRRALGRGAHRVAIATAAAPSRPSLTLPCSDNILFVANSGRPCTSATSASPSAPRAGNVEITDPGLAGPKGQKRGYMGAGAGKRPRAVMPATDIYALGKVLAEARRQRVRARALRAVIRKRATRQRGSRSRYQGPRGREMTFALGHACPELRNPVGGARPCGLQSAAPEALSHGPPRSGRSGAARFRSRPRGGGVASPARTPRKAHSSPSGRWRAAGGAGRPSPGRVLGLVHRRRRGQLLFPGPGNAARCSDRRAENHQPVPGARRSTSTVISEGRRR